MGSRNFERRIWLFSANKIESSESGSKQPTQLIIAAHNCHTYSSQNQNFIRHKKYRKSNVSWPEIPMYIHIKRADSYLFLGFHLTMLAHLAQQTWFVGILQRCRRHRQLWILDLAKTWLVEFVSVHPVNDLGPGWKTVLKIKIEVLVNNFHPCERKIHSNTTVIFYHYS